MAENKKSIIVYADWMEQFTILTDEEAGKLIKHFFLYVNDLNPTAIDRLTEMLFIPLKQSLKRDLKKWETILQDRSYNGRMGNIKRWNRDLYNKIILEEITLEEAENIAKHRKTSLPDANVSPPIANIAVSVSDSVSVNDINKVVIGEKTPKLPKSNKEELLKLRNDSFRKEVGLFIKEYPKEILRSFFDYWTEPNKSKTKMKWELQQTFDINLRLKNWTKNEKQFNNKSEPNKKLNL
jgi:hypothetical protein